MIQPKIPRPPRLPSDSASLPRAPLSLDLGDLETFTDGEGAGDGGAATTPCPAQPQSARPTVPTPAKTSRIRRR